MLVLCYGITKSGSTLAFELVKGILESVGHRQTRLPDVLVTPDHSVNFVQQIDRDKLEPLLEVATDRWIAVKTHARLRDPVFPYLEELQSQRRVQVVASYRDPREICLSLIDAGDHARSRGRKAFSEFAQLEDAVPAVLRQIENFRRWGALNGTLRLGYDLVAFAPDEAIDRIERSLGIRCDHEHAKQHAFAEAFTQKNKAQRQRAKEELSEEQYARLTEIFSDFIQSVCEADDETWFSTLREQILTKVVKRRAHRR